jgi:hypothetical protein
MSSDRVTTKRESVPDRWTALDDVFFTMVAEVLSTRFLWGAATLLASYDADDLPVATALPSPRPENASLPSQRSLAA